MVSPEQKRKCEKRSKLNGSVWHHKDKTMDTITDERLNKIRSKRKHPSHRTLLPPRFIWEIELSACDILSPNLDLYIVLSVNYRLSQKKGHRFVLRQSNTVCLLNHLFLFVCPEQNQAQVHRKHRF